ncbi:hypothetical protein O181_094220 [Austropuccinia psidii MF-1]|uniref:Uncharacterized protein n=1 Tax=Austropuccinia psidii MF-1 TaxID=1389203 RepID=A0A9Q3J1N9_9BASI|nr:hypothetical protein [Austropuccinia psidii MF-1]
MENSSESTIFNLDKDKQLTLSLKQGDRLSALQPDMTDSMINTKTLRKWGGEVENSIKCRCVEPCSTEDYISTIEDIITRVRIGKTWTRNPIESKIVPITSREDRRPESPVFKCHKCGRTSHLAKTFIKKTKINKFQFI